MVDDIVRCWTSSSSSGSVAVLVLAQIRQGQKFAQSSTATATLGTFGITPIADLGREYTAIADRAGGDVSDFITTMIIDRRIIIFPRSCCISIAIDVVVPPTMPRPAPLVDEDQHLPRGLDRLLPPPAGRRVAGPASAEGSKPKRHLFTVSVLMCC